MDEVTKLKLKSQALLERVSAITAESEDRISDLRVELTEVAAERDELKMRLEAPQEGVNGEVVQGKVETPKTFDPGEYVDN